MRDKTWLTSASTLALVAASTLSAASAFDEQKIKVEDLPKVVVGAAKKAFPEAKVVGAAKEVEDGETMYEVMLTLDGKSIDLGIDDDGDIEAVEREIDVEDLPKAVIRAAAKNFPTGKIVKVEEVSDEDDVVVYELAIKIGDKKPIEIVMSPNGKVLEPDDDDDDKAKKKDKDDDKKDKQADKKDKKDKA